MSARDDYPADGALPPGVCELDSQLYEDAMDEIDRLRRWRSEALDVLDEWDLVYDECGAPGPLGASKARAVLAYVRGLHSEVADLRSAAREGP